MSASSETDILELPIFEDNDKPSWLGDFNNAMILIDSIITGDRVALDANIADKVNTASVTRTALDARYAGTAFFKRRAGAGALTTGDVITLGSNASNERADIGTGIVAGGAPSPYENVVGGNTANVNTATSNLLGAAALAAENGNWDFLLAGYDNVVNGWACIVLGFHIKVGIDANHITVSGGSIHTVNPATSYGTIAGGTGHVIGGADPTVSGGATNTATGNNSTVGGGNNNQATSSGATVGGGSTNTATNSTATVGGGNTNNATGNSSTIGGGLTNTASATGATVPGGRENVASGEYSVASGRGAVATEVGMRAHSGGVFAVAGDAQINQWQLKKQTTDATVSNLEHSTGAPPNIPVDTTWAFTAIVVARRTDVDGDNAAFEVKGCFKRDAGNTAALVGAPTVTSLGASAGAATWTVTVSSQSGGALLIRGTGEAAKTIRWVCELSASQASG
jgi:hypothetical protein